MKRLSTLTDRKRRSSVDAENARAHEIRSPHEERNSGQDVEESQHGDEQRNKGPRGKGESLSTVITL